MAQVPCTKLQCGESIDYTPESDVAAGDVVVLQDHLVGIASHSIDADALGSLDLRYAWTGPKVTGGVDQGDALYWDDDANPVGGDAGTGAFTTDSSAGPFAGWAIADAESGDETVKFALRSQDDSATVTRSSLAQNDLQPYPILAESWFIFDSATHAALGATPASADDLSYITGVIGTAEPVLKAADFGGTNTTQKARIRVALPPEYVAGETITIRANAGMLTTVSHQTATIDFSAYRAADPTVDLVATAAQSINSLTAADKDFTVTPTDCVPGDILDILMTVAGTDDTDAGVMVPVVNSVELRMDIKG